MYLNDVAVVETIYTEFLSSSLPTVVSRTSKLNGKERGQTDGPVARRLTLLCYLAYGGRSWW
jgi:hypothetical protein